MPQTPQVTIVIPTFRRPGPLRRALASLLAQEVPQDLPLEILVVDNAPEAGARETVDAFAMPAHPVRYLHVAEPGIANARNGGIADARGAWIAFLDDDEEAGPDWIASFWKTLQATGADAAFGPVVARAEQPGGQEELLPYFARRVEAAEGADLTRMAAYLGTNNSIFSKARCLAGPAPFDPALNESGGEDTLVIKRLLLEGRRLAWSAKAEVVEWVPAARLNSAYVGRRLFLSGQIRSFVLTMLSPPRWPEVALWMGIGAAQSVIGGLRYLVLRPFDRPGAERARLTIQSGLGKIFWMQRFRPRLYGSGLVS